MGVIQQYGDNVVRQIDERADDEYHRDMLHRANSVRFETVGTMSFLFFAVSAWVLSGSTAIAAFLAVLPAAISSDFGAAWQRSYAPRPRATRRMTTATTLRLILYVIGVIGLTVNLFQDGQDGMSGFFVGSITVVLTALIAGPALTTRMRRRDQQRLDAELED